MTERAQELIGLGYSASQAPFLELAALQSGYFTRSQFNDCIERCCGAMGQVFIERALEKGHVKCIDSFGGRRLYQTVGQGLFRALGDENNRNRRSHRPATIRRRLMSLDYCISVKASTWLLTERDKTSFFSGLGASEEELPSELFGGARRFFVDRQPIWIRQGGVPVFVFIDEALKGLSQWDAFLRSHRALVKRLGKAAFVFAGAQPERFVRAERIFGRVITGAGTSGGMDLARLRRYFEARRRFEARDYSSFDQLRLDQLREDRRVFVGERIEGLYASWCLAGDAALTPVTASEISFEVHLLSHCHEWVSPVYGEERRECDAHNSIANKAGARGGHGKA